MDQGQGLDRGGDTSAWIDYDDRATDDPPKKKNEEDRDSEMTEKNLNC